jgi:hypothetical protein
MGSSATVNDHFDGPNLHLWAVVLDHLSKFAGATV